MAGTLGAAPSSTVLEAVVLAGVTTFLNIGTPTGNRTQLCGVKNRYPMPIDDGSK